MAKGVYRMKDDEDVELPGRGRRGKPKRFMGVVKGDMQVNGAT